MAYERLRQIVLDIVNCEDGAPTPRAFARRIAELHTEGAISSVQYGNLMCYVEDMV